MIAKKVLPFLILLLAAKCLKSQQLQLILFMSETCPICKSVTSELRKIDETYPDSVLSIKAYFPTRTAIKKESLSQFARKYKLGFDLLPDSSFANAKLFNATVTPEALLIDIATNRIVYRGSIDDSFASVGKRRTIVKNQYLSNAIEAWRSGKSPEIPETQAVGCIIQYP
jgi:peroxiredoxin